MKNEIIAAELVELEGAIWVRNLWWIDHRCGVPSARCGTEAIVATEAAGAVELRPLRGMTDPDERTASFRRLARETRHPSFALALEGHELARRADDGALANIGLGLLELSLHHDAEAYVREHAARFAEALFVVNPVNRAAYFRDALAILARALHEAAPQAHTNVERVDVILRLLRVFGEKSHGQPPGDKIADDLLLCRERLLWARDRTDEAIRGAMDVSRVFENAAQARDAIPESRGDPRSP